MLQISFCLQMVEGMLDCPKLIYLSNNWCLEYVWCDFFLLNVMHFHSFQSETFARCHRIVSPEPFFSSCVYDLCVCMDNSSCLCDILATYAHECAKAGVKVEWRSRSLCGKFLFILSSVLWFLSVYVGLWG